MKHFIIVILLNFLLFASSLARAATPPLTSSQSDDSESNRPYTTITKNQNPIGLHYIHELMTKLGLLGQEGWLIDRKESLQILKEISETLEKYPGADYQKVTFEINSVRSVRYLPPVEEDWVYRLMDEAGLLEQEEQFLSTNKEIFHEIQEVLRWYPGAGYLRVTAEINRIRLTKENSNIVFWPRVYMIMEANGLLINNDVFVFEEIKQAKQDHYKNSTFADRIAELINAVRYNRGQKFVEVDQVYRLMSQEKGWLKQRKNPLILEKDINLLAEIKTVLEDYQKVGFEKVTFVMVTAEINYRRLQNSRYLDESVETVNQDTVYRIMHEAGLLKKEEQSIISEEELILEEIIKGLEKNPDNDYEILTAGINNTRSTDEQIPEEHIHKLANKTGLMELEAQPISTVEYNRIYQEIIERLIHNPETSYLKITIEFNLTHLINTWKLFSEHRNDGKKWLLERIKEIKAQEQYKDCSIETVTEIINSTLDESQKKVFEYQVGKLMRQHNIPRGKQGGTTINKEEDAEILEEIRQLLHENSHHTVDTIVEEIKKIRLAQNKPRVGRDRIKRIMREANLLKKRGGTIDRIEEAEIAKEIRQLVNDNPSHTGETLKEELDRRRLAQNKPTVSENRINRIRREVGLLKEAGSAIDRSEDAEILKGIKQIVNDNPHYTSWKITKEFNKIRLAQKKPTISEEKITRIMLEAGLLSPEQYQARWKNKRRKPIAAGAGGVGLIATTEVEKGYSQDQNIIEIGELNTSTVEQEGFNTSTIETAFSMQSNNLREITPHTEEITLEMIGDMLSTIGEMAGYVLEGGGEAIPLGIGAAISASAILTGTHPMTRRPLTRDERIKIAKWLPLNFIGWKFLQHLVKPLTNIHFSKWMNLFNKDQLKEAKELFVSFLRSTGDIKRKAKPTRPKRKIVVEEGGYSTGEVVELTVLNADKVNRINPGELHKAIDITNPRTSKVFIQTPDGNQISLDFNNSEVSKLLRHTDTVQRQALESLMKNRTKTSAKPADFSELVLH